MTRRYVRALIALMAPLAIDACGRPSPTAPATRVNAAPTLALTTQGPPSCNPVGVASCLEGGVTLDIYRTATSGTCDVTLKVRDSANLVGTTVARIRY